MWGEGSEKMTRSDQGMTGNVENSSAASLNIIVSYPIIT